MRVLILSCGTGGGHNAAASAMKEALEARGHSADVLNPYTLKTNKLAKIIDVVYVRLVQISPTLFGCVYKIGAAYRRLPWRSPVYFVNAQMVPVMDKYLKDVREVKLWWWWKMIEKINNNQDIDFSPVFNAIKQDSDYQIDSLKKVVNENSKITINKLNEEFIKLQNNLKDNTLIDKLTTIEENLKEVQNKSNKIEVNNIDEQLDNLINSINDNDSIIGTNSFKKYILDNPLVLDYLRDYFKNDKKVLTKLNKL